MSGLPNSRRKIARAKEHRDDFERKFKEFWSSHQQTGFFEPHPQVVGHEVLKIRVIGAIPMDSFCNIIDDAVVNLRSALDTAGYALAKGAGRVPNPTCTAFPFADEEARLNGQIKRVSKHIPEELYPVFHGYKPYRRGDDVFWGLNKACNFNKHQGLLRLGVEPTLGNVDGVGGLVRLLAPPWWDSAKQEFEIGTFIRGTEAHYNIEFGMFIAFDEIEAIGGQPVSRVLDYWIDVVEHLISTLESEGTRLGFLR